MRENEAKSAKNKFELIRNNNIHIEKEKKGKAEEKN